eukprot:CAMPEP_0196812702 /NCGR_PEP_ID=MMETSP1362-20130617/29652_1 /TAXON_ID=163516 /ORGANISM="Leptocylindrus danicus, Strain CCMP1856" /LENGTH=329 /DNA_ID=CAMNT_0042188517 /DNA_START=118 /DNA_END=1107 /DNA_ORIENTATION=+
MTTPNNQHNCNESIKPTTTTTTSAISSAANENQHIIDTAAAVEYARICGGLKRTKRTGWVYRKVRNPESVADHSWRVAALCLLLLDNRNEQETAAAAAAAERTTTNGSIDIGKCIQLAVVHDLAEAIVGDIAPADNVSKAEKARMEEEAIIRISNKLSAYRKGSGDYLIRLFEEYEARESQEAIAVKDLDLLDMIIQADEYECEALTATNSCDNALTLNLQEFFDGTGIQRFRNKWIRDVASEVHHQRNERVRAASNNNTISTTTSTLPASFVNVGNSSIEKGHVHESLLEHSLSTEDEQFVNGYCNNSGQDYDVVANIVSALRMKDAE